MSDASIISRLMGKLRRGTATVEEIENLDRRLFCLGAAASAAGIVARPTIVDLAVRPRLHPWVVVSPPQTLSPLLVGYYLYRKMRKDRLCLT